MQARLSATHTGFANGDTKDVAKAFLGPPRTRGYKSMGYGLGLGVGGFHVALQRGMFHVWDVPAMLLDQQIQFGLRVLLAPLAGVQMVVLCDRPDVTQFVVRTLRRIWANELGRIARRMFEWGSVGAEVCYERAIDTDLIEFDKLTDFQFGDAVPLERRGELAGLRVKRTFASSGQPTDLLMPRYFWAAHEPPPGHHLGRSRLAPAWESWMEKRGKHGAVDVRRLWYLKHVYRGAIIRHPPGSMTMADGSIMSNQDYARQIVEKAETGGVFVLPNGSDEHGNYQWTMEFAEIKGGGVTELLEYPRELDTEMLKGMGIMPEVVQASEVGSGWSGRSVPFVVFLRSLDFAVKMMLDPIVECILEPLVWVNYGDVTFTVMPVSLVPKEQADAGAGGQKPGEGGQPPPGANGKPPAPQPTGGNPQTLIGQKGGVAPLELSLGESAGDMRKAIAEAAAETDKDPSDEQKKAGNYRKGKVWLHGLEIAIENPAGSMRRGMNKAGKAWEQKLANHYGYIKSTESEADGDHVDVFLGPEPESAVVYVIDQQKPDGAFDEHKCMMCFRTADAAYDAYHANYAPGWKGFAGIKEMSLAAFKEWVRNGRTDRALAGHDEPTTFDLSVPFDENKINRDKGQFSSAPGAGAAAQDPAAGANGKNGQPAETFELPATEQQAQSQAVAKAHGFLSKAVSLPQRAVTWAAGKASQLYSSMERKYGPKWAKAIVAVGVVTLPTPFTTAAVLATCGLAKLSLKLFGGKSAALSIEEDLLQAHQVPPADDPNEPVDLARALEIARAEFKAFWQTAMQEWQGEAPAAGEQEPAELSAFVEGEHPRGQPDNAGQFVEKVHGHISEYHTTQRVTKGHVATGTGAHPDRVSQAIEHLIGKGRIAVGVGDAGDPHYVPVSAPSFLHGKTPAQQRAGEAKRALENEVQNAIKTLPNNPAQAAEAVKGLSPEAREQVASRFEAPHYEGDKWAKEMATAIRGTTEQAGGASSGQEVRERFAKLPQVESDGYPSDTPTGEVSTNNFFKTTSKAEMTEVVVAIDHLFAKSGTQTQEDFVAKYAKTEEVKIADLKSTQPTVEEEKVAKLVDEKERLNNDAEEDLPVVIKRGNDMFAWDGQHRIVAKKMTGKETTKARVIDLSSTSQAPATKPEATPEAPPGFHESAAPPATATEEDGAPAPVTPAAPPPKRAKRQPKRAAQPGEPAVLSDTDRDDQSLAVGIIMSDEVRRRVKAAVKRVAKKRAAKKPVALSQEPPARPAPRVVRREEFQRNEKGLLTGRRVTEEVVEPPPPPGESPPQ